MTPAGAKGSNRPDYFRRPRCTQFRLPDTAFRTATISQTTGAWALVPGQEVEAFGARHRR
jgi:hypothetical protein